jgi:hypothetical protein
METWIDRNRKKKKKWKLWVAGPKFSNSDIFSVTLCLVVLTFFDNGNDNVYLLIYTSKIIIFIMFNGGTKI